MNKSSKDKIAFDHPAIFPEELVYKHLITWSKEGDLVYDPFMGSGTTAKISILLNRKWLGSEIDSSYCEICNQRIQTIGVQSNLFYDVITKNSLKK
jgi:site-specific DNA-methyltransferase (adenine-specific)